MEKSVQLTLQPITVTVNVKKGATDTETLELAKKELVNQLNGGSWPPITYAITDGVSMRLEECFGGQLVKFDGDAIGIITCVNTRNKFPVTVATTKGLVNCTPVALQKLDKEINVTNFRNRPEYLRELRDWPEGFVGYFVNKGEVFPVVLGKTTRNKTKVYVITTTAEGRYYSLDQSSMKRIFDTETEASTFLTKVNIS